jgi:alcohol dehydrogenase class IV
VIDIARQLHETKADCLISIGSSSYSDACKIARILHAVLPPTMTEADVEGLIDQNTGIAKDIKGLPSDGLAVKLINVPTSLSASEWNPVSSATNSKGKKQHFGYFHTPTSAELVVCDPKVAATAPRELWLSSGVRAIDHCIETASHTRCTPELRATMMQGLASLIVGLKEYVDGQGKHDDQTLLEGVSKCQWGSRDSMMGLLVWRIPMGPSHAIGHQLGPAM